VMTESSDSGAASSHSRVLLWNIPGATPVSHQPLTRVRDMSGWNPMRMTVTMVAVLTVGALTGGSLAAQTVTGSELKAAYLFNFIRFMEWSRDPVPPGTDVALCIVDDDLVATALERTIRGRTLQGHALSVRILKTGTPLPICQLLYLAGSNLQQSLDMIATVKGSVVLTVSDAERFAQMGGMVELFADTGRVRFAVNTDALRRGGVVLSSRVLTLAKIVTDNETD
jgi:hypothetical protein